MNVGHPRVLPLAALSALCVLALAMFVAMLVGVPPHPAGARGPYLAALLALSAAVAVLLVGGAPSARPAGLLTGVVYLPAVGPHKFWTEPAAVALAPLIVLGTLAVAVLLLAVVRMPSAPDAR